MIKKEISSTFAELFFARGEGACPRDQGRYFIIYKKKVGDYAYINPCITEYLIPINYDTTSVKQ